MTPSRKLNLVWGKHERSGKDHTEWYAPCGCGYHPEPYPHVHPCSKEHDRVAKAEARVRDEDAMMVVKYLNEKTHKYDTISVGLICQIAEDLYKAIRAKGDG